MPHDDDDSTSEAEAFRRLMEASESELPKPPEPPSIFKPVSRPGDEPPEERPPDTPPFDPGGADPVLPSGEQPFRSFEPEPQESKSTDERTADALEEILAELILIHDQLDNVLGGG